MGINPMERKKVFLSVWVNGLRNQNVNKMKLYTEEQVREAIDRAREGIRIYRVNEFETEKEFDFSEDSVINSLIPIEFPSDEDIIKDYANRANGYNVYAKEIKAPIFNEGFAEGAKWVIKQIKQQSDGN